ncbi:hypothetical protein P5V15_006842 [Pogonomyrmex californicus]
MCDKFLEKSREDHTVFVDESFITKKDFLRLIEDSECVQKIPTPSSIVYPKANLYYAFGEDVHPMKRIIAASKFFGKDKLLPQVASCEEPFANEDLDLEDKAVNHYLKIHPASFVIFGKPLFLGTGLNFADVASAIAEAQNCVLISPISLIEEEIAACTDKGRYMERILRLGQSIGPEILMILIRRRVGMRDVRHRGYVIGCLPFIPNDLSYSNLVLDDTCEFCENTAVESNGQANEGRITSDDLICKTKFDYERRISQQIDEIFTTWPIKPKIIIYLVCPKQDVANTLRRTNHLADDSLNESEFAIKLFESEHDDSDSYDFSQVANKRWIANNDQSLMKVISDITRNVEMRCDLYERLALPVIDKWILTHDPQHVIRVDGRSSTQRILEIVQTRLCTLALLPSILPREMIEQNDVRLLETSPKINEVSDELAVESAEKAFEILKQREIVSSIFPWRLSAWKFYCPVELAQGRTVKGLPKHAVRFLNKIFFLSSREAKNLFIENPRTFLLPPNPRPTCKIAVFGPKYSGKSELSTKLAKIFGGTVINVDEVVKKSIRRYENPPIRELHENDSSSQISLKPFDISAEEKADIIIQNIKQIPHEELEDELRRDGGYIVDGMCMDIKVWQKIVDDANIMFEDIVVLFEDEPYAYLLNKFLILSHLDDSLDDMEADREEHVALRKDAEWEYLEHLTRFESEWAIFEQQIPESRENIIKCNLANIKDVTEYVVNCIKRRFDVTITAPNVEEKDKGNEIPKETAENNTNLANKNTKEKEKENLAYTVDLDTAERLLECGYCFFSSFGRWCPVQIYIDEIPILMFLPMKARGQIYPVVRHPYIYFFSGEEALNAFLKNSSKYLAQDVRPSLLPLRISIIGPPKCGKTTLANRLAKTYGMKVITRGKALCHMLKHYPWTESARIIENQLRAGQAASIESVTRAIEMSSIGPRAATQGYVLDDCPSNRKEAEQLAILGMQPMIVLDLKADLDFCLECLAWDSDDTKSPLNFSADFLSRRYADWKTNQASFRDWLKKFSQNVAKLDATKSKWYVWTRADHAVRSRFADIVLYSREANLDKVHNLRHMCVSPYEFRSRQSRYESCCPVCFFRENILRTSGELVNSQGMVQFREYFYWICPQHIDTFVKDPLYYLLSVTTPLLDELPRILQEIVDTEHACWAQRLQVGGLCLVTYVDGLPERNLTRGRVDLGVTFKDKVYLFCNEECREKFLTRPDKYSEMDIAFPRELPPIEVRHLPDRGFLEQTVARTLVEAVNLVAARRPKIAGLSAVTSAAVCIGVYLKMHNAVENSIEMDIYEAASKRIAERNRIIEIATDAMKRKQNP